MKYKLVLIIQYLILTSAASAAILQVGPTRQYPTPCKAITAAAEGDQIEIDGGTYVEVCSWTKNRLHLRGVNGRPIIDANGRAAHDKAAWMIYGADTIVENIELRNTRSTSRNGAGIKLTGGNLTVRDCVFRNNENGILTSDGPAAELLVERTEFDRNGDDIGYAHNIYVGRLKKLTFRYNYSHHAKVGHLLKSRAIENHILYNRLTNEATGTASREIDLPNGGLSFVIGNVIQQGPATRNSGLVGYLLEGVNPYTLDNRLFVIHNTFVNDGPAGTYLKLAAEAAPMVAVNNLFSGNGTLTTQAGAVLLNNLVSSDPKFIDRMAYDYRLRPESPAVDYGIDPTGIASFVLKAVAHYRHPQACESRALVMRPDVGAWEYNGGVPSISGDCLTEPRETDSSKQASTAALLLLRTAKTSTGGGSYIASNRVYLEEPAGPGGVVVALQSSNPAVATVPVSVTVPAGAKIGTFPISTVAVSVPVPVTITGTLAGVTKNGALTVEPIAPYSFSLVSPSIAGGTSADGNLLYLNGPAQGTVLSFTSSLPGVVIDQVRSAFNSAEVTFRITAPAVTVPSAATIQVAGNGVTRSTVVTILP